MNNHFAFASATINRAGRLAAALQKGESMDGRYKAIPEKTENRSLVYVVIDTETGEWKHVYDCFLWAEHKADEMNKIWSIMNGRDQE